MRGCFLSGSKSNDLLHIYYVPNVFKFTKIPAKRTQGSLKWYERTQKCQRRPNIPTSKIFTALYISNGSRIKLWRCNDKGTRIVYFFITLKNYFPYLVLLSAFKILMPNLGRRAFEF